MEVNVSKKGTKLKVFLNVSNGEKRVYFDVGNLSILLQGLIHAQFLSRRHFEDKGSNILELHTIEPLEIANEDIVVAA
jgi:hypothetical protein